eukprot:2480087-Amphidinium_carterae.2
MDSVAVTRLCTGVAPPSGWRGAAPGAHGVAPIVQPRGTANVERTLCPGSQHTRPHSQIVAGASLPQGGQASSQVWPPAARGALSPSWLVLVVWSNGWRPGQPIVRSASGLPTLDQCRTPPFAKYAAC